MDDEPALDAARILVSQALSVRPELIAPGTKMYDLPGWDSLGQLSVILAIEEDRGVRIADDALFARLTSVRGIADYLAAVARGGSV